MIWGFLRPLVWCPTQWGYGYGDRWGDGGSYHGYDDGYHGYGYSDGDGDGLGYDDGYHGYGYSDGHHD